MSLFERLISLFAPDACLSCRREGALLCEKCRPSLSPPEGVCFDCQAQTTGVVCSPCLLKSGCGSIIAATEYQGFAKQLVASLKFAGNQSAARIMARQMMETTELPQDILIAHVPATTAHIRQRGYDQAALLAKRLARLTGCSHSNLLARLGSKHQLGADRLTRLAQLERALRIRRPQTAKGRHIVLVDDVLTTGASIRAASAALLQSGAARVDVLVFAQATPSQIKKTS